MFFWGREDEDKRRPKEWSNLIMFSFSKTTFFGHILLKKLAHSLFGAWSLLLVHIQFTPSEGPKGVVNRLFKKSDHGGWTIKSDHGKDHLFMVGLHSPWCKPTPKWREGALSYMSVPLIHPI